MMYNVFHCMNSPILIIVLEIKPLLQVKQSAICYYQQKFRMIMLHKKQNVTVNIHISPECQFIHRYPHVYQS